MNDKKEIYLPGLNGIRAIAAIGVMVSHISLSLNHFVGHQKGSGMALAGEGVTMFFTLSGFLISYLLLIEENQSGTISLKNFYLRRILRIWPLYFAIIGIVCIYYGIFGNGIANIEYIWLYFIFLANLAFNFSVYPQDLAPLWSIAIEEQFYLIWPWIFKKRGINIVRNLFIFVIIFGVLKLAMKIISIQIGTKIPFSIISSMGFDNMAIGAIGAILYYNNSKILLKISNSIVIPLLYFLLVLFLIFNLFSWFSIFGSYITSFLTTIFIVYQIRNPDSFFSLERPILNFLGRISFGIYVYHSFIISMFSDITKAYFPNLMINTFVINCLIILITIFIAYLSYNYFERYFLRFKKKFSSILSRN